MARRKPRHLRAVKAPSSPVASAAAGVIIGEARPMPPEHESALLAIEAANDGVEIVEPVAEAEPAPEPVLDPDGLYLHSVTLEEREKVVQTLWPAFEGFIWKACKRSGEDLTPEWVFAELMADKLQLHLVLSGAGQIRGCLITQIALQPSGLVTVMMTLASGVGVGKRLAELYPSFLHWCARQGASSIRYIGRPGWVRASARLGFQPIAVMAEAKVPPLHFFEAPDGAPVH